MEAIHSFETSVLTRVTRRHIPIDDIQIMKLLLSNFGTASETAASETAASETAASETAVSETWQNEIESP
jgi:hypothetical protein